MSLARVILLSVQAVCNQWACTSPNPTPSKGRYHTEEWSVLQMAPLIFKIHQFIIWTCTAFEVLFYLTSLLPSTPHHPISSVVCPVSQGDVHIHPLFVIGVVCVILGTYIRLDCFRTLGQLFTFDLTILPQHKLVTSRFYGYVRHPAYTGSILLIAGLAFSHLTEGSWMSECGPLRSSVSAGLVWAAWWVWSICVCVSRARAEDKQMRALFKEEWEAYAISVPWWFFPGIL